MDPAAMEPFGLALLAFERGDASAELVVVRDDGREDRLPARHFFRGPSELSAIERRAIELCRGRVLDAGAGAGVHSLALQERGLRVTALDVLPRAVELLRRRGVRETRCADILDLQAGPFDTVLLLGHGIGIVEDLAGLDRFLRHAPGLLAEGGQVLLDSRDVRVTDDPANLACHEANRRAGRSLGEVLLREGSGDYLARLVRAEPGGGR